MSHDPIPPELARVLRRFPHWQARRGVSGIWYARRPRSSPPIVLRGETPTELAGQVTEREADH